MNQSLALNIMKSGKNVFLTGQAGAGKTYVLNQYIQRLWDCNVSVAITASTGIAATHIGGVTIHSWSGIGIQQVLSERDIDMIAQKEKIHKQVMKARVLIIDEISMLSAKMLDNVQRVIQHIKQDYRPWGGMQVILCGDFFQLPPVSRYGEDKKRFAFAAQAWNGCDLHFCYLDTQYRQQSSDEFTQVLNQLRVGTVSEHALQLLESRKNIALPDTAVRLYTHNVDVDRVNAERLEELSGEIFAYKAQKEWDKKLTNNLLKGMLAPDYLELKVGAHVLFVRNNPALGYYNGTTGEVVWFTRDKDLPIVRVRDGEEIVVWPERRGIENADAIVASVTQLPLKLAWAITVHKSQGMSLDAAVMDLSKVFEPGQAYVALSRVRSLEGLSLEGLHVSGLRAHDLVVRWDRYFAQQSALLEKQFHWFASDDREELHRSYLTMMGGMFRTAAELGAMDRTAKTVQQSSSRVDTYQQTADLVTQGKSLDELIELRWLTKQTIIKHLSKIKALYPSINMSHLQPNDAVMQRVHAAAMSAAEDEWNFTDAGTLRVSVIYQMLQEEVSYDDIYLSLLFLVV